MLCEAHGPRKGARVLAGVIAAIVRLGEGPVSEVVGEAIQAGGCDLSRLRIRLFPRLPKRAPVPEKLRGYEIHAAGAADYDWLLKGGGR
jgi:hypothetical protein